MSADSQDRTNPVDSLEAKALLRLLAYAMAEANNLGLENCAELIDRAADEVRQQVAQASPAIHGADHSRIH